MQQSQVLFINAVHEVAREQAHSFLRESHQQKILEAYRRFEDQYQFATVATLEQIADEGYSLAIPRYVAGARAAEAGDQLDMLVAVAEWSAASDVADRAITDVLTLLRAEGPS